MRVRAVTQSCSPRYTLLPSRCRGEAASEGNAEPTARRAPHGHAGECWGLGTASLQGIYWASALGSLLSMRLGSQLLFVLGEGEQQTHSLVPMWLCMMAPG